MYIQNRFCILSSLIFLLGAGCGDAFRRESFQQANSTPGYTTVNFSKNSVSREAALNFMDAVRDFQGPGLFTIPSSGSIIYAWNQSLSNLPTTQRINGGSGSMSLANGYTYSYGLIGSDADPITSAAAVYTVQGMINGAGTAGDSVALNGSPVSVSFTPTSASQSGIFQYRQLALGICSATTTLTGSDSVTTNCSALSGAAPGYGTAKGLKIVFASTNQVGKPIDFNGSSGFADSLVTSHSLLTSCIALGASTGIASSSFPVTVGYSASEAANLRLKAYVVSYTDTSCTTIHKVYEFPKGLWAVSNPSWSSVGNPSFEELSVSTGLPVSGSTAAASYNTTPSAGNTHSLFIKE